MDFFSFSNSEQRFKEKVERLSREKIKPLAEQYGETDEVPQEIVDAMKEAGIFRILFPEQYGGDGVSAVKLCIAREALSRFSVVADVTLAMQGLGGYPIVVAGDKEQKEKYLPLLAGGDLLSTYALTEPGAGSDVASMESTAVKDGDCYILNGTKRFISNGYRADMGVVFAKTDRDRGNRGISAFIYTKGMEGLSIRKRIKLMALHDLVELQFTDCRVPATNMLGAENGGFKTAMKTLDLLRMSVGASALGTARAALDLAVRFSLRRKTFGNPISGYQGVSFKIAEMATELDAARLLVYRAADLMDKGAGRVTKESSMAKYYATEMAGRVVDMAVQIHGGIGVTRGMDVERLFREARAPRVYEGTTEIQKMVIANLILREAKERGDDQPS
jgi:alkylation response protein AidB-like acyl-CoA dehydrogenase